jgi:hypothetical protein
MRNGNDWLYMFRLVAGTAEFVSDAGIQKRTRHKSVGVDHRGPLLDGLAALERLLDSEPPHGSIDRLRGFGGYGHALYVPLTATELRRMERLCARVWHAQGTNRARVEETLLGHIAVMADEASLPFYRSVLAFVRPRDSFATERKRIIVAAIALLAGMTGSQAAHAHLGRLLTHESPLVRSAAIDSYAQLHVTSEGTLPPDAAQRLHQIAEHDRAFAPQFIARDHLARAGQQVPMNTRARVYAFSASLGRASCTVELTASQSLDDLARAILEAFAWDRDHLYEFALTGSLRDRRYVLPAEPDEPIQRVWPAHDASRTAQPSTMDLPLGALGLPTGHQMIFRYDFGDNHQFKVVIAAIHPQQDPRARYPRVVTRPAKLPEQYPRDTLYE